MVTSFRTARWRPVPRTATTRPACGADLEALDAASLPDRLARAVWGAEPDTARRCSDEPVMVRAAAEKTLGGQGSLEREPG